MARWCSSGTILAWACHAMESAKCSKAVVAERLSNGLACFRRHRRACRGTRNRHQPEPNTLRAASRGGALFDARTVTWSAIDGDHACATLRLGDQQVSGIFEFGSDGLPLRMTAKRFKDKGDLLPWGGIYRDWRTVSGMRVPFEAEVSWQLTTGPYTYAHWFVESMDYDETPPRQAP